MLEGHPDNVAPCLFGGLTIAWLTADAAGLPRARAIRLDPRPDVHPVAFIAPEPVSTSVARGLLPPTVPHADAARNAGRAALLIAALTVEGVPSADTAALLDGTEDKLHQDYRAPAMPHSHDLVTRLRAARVPAVVSGAGPSVLAFLTGPGAAEGLPAAGKPVGADLNQLDSIAAETGIDWHITPLAVERQGAIVAPSVSGTR
jgi:homoserine kinase